MQRKIAAIDKKEEMKKMIKAIHFHETKTTLKTLYAFHYMTRKLRILRIKARRVKIMVLRNLVVFYMKTYIKAFRRQQKRMYLRSVAKSYFVEQRKYKTLMIWRSTAQNI